MVLFDIIKHCQNEKDKCKINYKKTSTAGNDPNITRRMRYAQRVTGLRYVTKVNRVETKGTGILDAGLIHQPKGQIFENPRKF
jgi:hypothetical protein